MFPVTYSLASLTSMHRPALARLAPVDEYEQSNASSNGDLGVLPSDVPRVRLESTASSRFFPGGWFSGNPKSPDENRTSLDHAAGEFSKSQM